MPAHYDSYDYSAYWNGREYEHESEVIALREFLKRIKKVNRALEIGGGFGRLVPFYVYRTQSTFFTEPSAKLLSLANSRLKNFKNIKFRQSTLENLTKRFRKESFDFILMVRVMHHLENPDEAFAQIEKLAAPGGYLCLNLQIKSTLKM
jgi:SAM-dependent methyltransferase